MSQEVLTAIQIIGIIAITILGIVVTMNLWGALIAFVAALLIFGWAFPALFRPVPTQPERPRTEQPAQPVQPIDGGGNISNRTDFAAVTLETNGRIWQQGAYDGTPAFEVDFTVPSWAAGNRMFNGINTVLLKDRAVVARNANSVPVNIVAGTYRAIGDPGNGTFSLEVR